MTPALRVPRYGKWRTKIIAGVHGAAPGRGVDAAPAFAKVRDTVSPRASLMVLISCVWGLTVSFFLFQSGKCMTNTMHLFKWCQGFRMLFLQEHFL